MNSVIEYLIQNKYLMPQVYDSEVPPELYLQFNGDRNIVRSQYLNSIDRVKLSMTLSKKGSATLIGKPVSYYPKDDYLVLRFQSTDVHIPFSQLDEEMIDELTTNFAVYHVQKVKQQDKTVILCKDFKLIFSETAISKAKKLIEYANHNGIKLLDLIILGYGYAIDKVTTTLFSWRVLPLFNVGGKPIHIAEFSSPNAGKTTYAIRNKFMLSWEYVNEVPSYPRLVMDARTNTLGIVFTSHGVVIDEFDKYGRDIREVIEVMLTGLEQGVWTRAKGSRGTPNIIKKIPFVLFGNTLPQKLSARDAFVDYFKTKYKMSEEATNALQDRFAVIVNSGYNVNVSDHVTGYVMQNTVLRALLKSVDIEYKDYGKYSGRRRVQYNQVVSILTALMNDNVEEYAQKLVEGYANFEA